MSPKKRLNILFADDGSQHAQAAVELIRSLPLLPYSRILVLHAFNSGQIPHISEYEQSIARTSDQFRSEGFRVETELKLSSPVDLILERAEQKKADLIVLGAKGLRSTVGILLGGVAQQVVEYAKCPVLIVRAPYCRVDHILVVVDGSAHSQYAASFLSKLPFPQDLDMRVMHVMPPIVYPVMMEPYGSGWRHVYPVYPDPAVEKAIEEKQSKAGQALLTRTSNMLQQKGFRPTTILARGDAATEIMNYADEHQMDLIVAGSRGLSQFKGILMGSLSRKLVHYSKSSVLIVKKQGKE